MLAPASDYIGPAGGSASLQSSARNGSGINSREDRPRSHNNANPCRRMEQFFRPRPSARRATVARSSGARCAPCHGSRVRQPAASLKRAAHTGERRACRVTGSRPWRASRHFDHTATCQADERTEALVRGGGSPLLRPHSGQLTQLVLVPAARGRLVEHCMELRRVHRRHLL